MQAVLERADEKNLRFNGRKCEFDKRNLTFYGHVFSEKGVSAYPRKIEAIQAMTPPSNVPELRSYLGMVNYCGRFIKDLATVTAPLRQLTKKNATFEWKPCHREAFEKLQNLLTEKKVMAYFNLTKHTELVVDASLTGLGAILLQCTPGKDDSRFITYASRALKEIEQRYSQTEREGLAIVFGCEDFRLYLYGIHFSLYTDHFSFISFHSFHFKLFIQGKNIQFIRKKTALQCALLKQKRKNKKKEKINYSINSKFYLIHCQINSLKNLILIIPIQPKKGN